MRADLSPRGRATNLARIASETFDLLVVGGGIVGAGTARDAATRGLSVALLEKGDFASGTSGKTSRMIHGGLRYLKRFKVGLVRTAVRERDLLLRRAPSLVRPVTFTIPSVAGQGEGPLALRFGLYLYDLLSRDKVLPRRAWLRPAAVLEREPALASLALEGGGTYHDATANDARLVLAVLRDAADAGAVVANHVEVLEVVREDGRVVGVRARDRLGTAVVGARARVVVNATGVWLDRLRAGGPRDTVRPTKGVHVFVPRGRVGNREAVVLRAVRDGRVIFVLPWGRLSLVGTTDTDHAGDLDRVLPDAADVAYLLDSVNAAFLGAHLGPRDVVSAYASLRPLLRDRGRDEESDVSREHRIFEDPDGLLSVAGGKLTTQRAMAQEVVDRVLGRLGRHAMCATRDRPLGPGPDARRALLAMGFDEVAADHLAGRHDPDSVRRVLDVPGAGEPIQPGVPDLWLDVSLAVEEEMAMTLEDVLVRRLTLFYEASDQGLGVVPAVADRMATLLGWNGDRVREEVEAYRSLVAAHRTFLEDHGR